MLAAPADAGSRATTLNARVTAGFPWTRPRLPLTINKIFSLRVDQLEKVLLRTKLLERRNFSV